jgi:hypothetical protein
MLASLLKTSRTSATRRLSFCGFLATSFRFSHRVVAIVSLPAIVNNENVDVRMSKGNPVQSYLLQLVP